MSGFVLQALLSVLLQALFEEQGVLAAGAGPLHRELKRVEPYSTDWFIHRADRKKLMQLPPMQKHLSFTAGRKHVLRKQQFLAGEVVIVPVTDPTLQKVALYANDQLNAMLNSSRRYSLVHIFNATEQLVAGMLYDVTFISGASVCRNTAANMGKTLAECPLDVRHPKTMICHTKVLERAYTPERYQLLDHVPFCA